MWKWDNAVEGETLPTVFILNMDVAKSKALASATHPVEYQEKINYFQKEVENILSGDSIYKDRWTGDGLVVLYRHEKAKVDDFINMALKVVSLLRKSNKEKHFKKAVGLRMGLAVGTIIFQKNIGGIVGNVMNKAGLFQKSCPGAGGILMTDGVYQFIKAAGLKRKFKPALFMMGSEIRSVYYHPQATMEHIPRIITSTGVTKEIDLSALYEGEAKLSDLDEYMRKLVAQAKEGQELVLTGRAPIWLYLHAVLMLKGNVKKLLYRDGPGHIYDILDQTLQ